jgi:hypothetical protein
MGPDLQGLHRVENKKMTLTKYASSRRTFLNLNNPNPFLLLTA